MWFSRSSATLAFIFVYLLLVSLVCAQVTSDADDTSAGNDGFNLIADVFNYDTDLPLDARIVARQDHGEYVREKLVFRGIRDSRVPAYLAMPAGDGPHPCVLLIHGAGGSKEDWWQDSFHGGEKLTTSLLSAGIAVATLDVQYHGERTASNDYESPEVFLFQRNWVCRARDMVVDSVVEHRRALDYLASRDEVDETRFGVVGYSMGGMMAFQLAAVEPRVQSSVSCVSPILDQPYSAIAVHNFASHVGDAPFLMVIGKDDKRNYTMEAAQKLFDRLSNTDKDLIVFDSGHKLPPEWIEVARAQIVSTLGPADNEELQRSRK